MFMVIFALYTLYLKYSVITPYNCHNHVIAAATCHNPPACFQWHFRTQNNDKFTHHKTTNLGLHWKCLFVFLSQLLKRKKTSIKHRPRYTTREDKKKQCCSQLYVEGTNKVATLLLSSQRPLNNGFASHHAVHCSVSWNWQPGPSYNSLYPLRRFSGQSEAHLLQLRSSLLPCIIHQDECWSQNKPHQQHIFCHSRETKGFKCSGTTTLTWKLWKTKSTQLKDADLCKHFFKL